jgi:hypothetical protein
MRMQIQWNFDSAFLDSMFLQISPLFFFLALGPAAHKNDVKFYWIKFLQIFTSFMQVLTMQIHLMLY